MGISATAVARVVGIEPTFKDLRGANTFRLPQRVAILAQGASAVTYPATPLQITSASQAGAVYGFGSPIHLMALQLFPKNGDGVGTIPVTVYPLVDDAGASASAGDITPTGTQTGAASYTVEINGIKSAPFVIADGVVGTTIAAAVVAAINATLEMPMIAVVNTLVIDLTAKWEGVSGDGCVITVVGPANGIIFAITQPTGGLVNPDVDPTLALIGSNTWETLILNAMEAADTATLDKFQTYGDGRYGALSHTPPVVFTGSVDDTVTAIAITDARKTDKINSYIRVVGSNTLPFQIAARAVARIAVVANENPARDFGGQQLTGILPGLDSVQEDYPTRDQSVTGGASTSKIVDGIVTLEDTVTFYHPDGENPPAFRFVKTIVKLSQVLHNLDRIFNTAEWNGAPLIPDIQATTNPAARKPKDAKARANTMLDGLGLDAIISDPETAKGKTTTVIDGGNPDRLNIGVTVQISGNSNIIDIALDFGFFFGSLPVL